MAVGCRLLHGGPLSRTSQVAYGLPQYTEWRGTLTVGQHGPYQYAIALAAPAPGPRHEEVRRAVHCIARRDTPNKCSCQVWNGHDGMMATLCGQDDSLFVRHSETRMNAAADPANRKTQQTFHQLTRMYQGQRYTGIKHVLILIFLELQRPLDTKALVG